MKNNEDNILMNEKVVKILNKILKELVKMNGNIVEISDNLGDITLTNSLVNLVKDPEFRKKLLEKDDH